MPLGRLSQADFSAGMFRSLAPQRIPQNGCFDLTDYLIDNEGSPYQRGGIDAFSDAFDSSDFTFVYDGLFEVGRRTFFATKTMFGVLDADGHTPIKLWDDSGVGSGYLGGGLDVPVRGTVIGGRIYLDGGRVYAGARQFGVIGATTGTASLAEGSDTVVGVGTAFTTEAGVGMVFGFGPRNYVVKSVTDDTHLVLTQNAKETTGAGTTFSLAAVGLAGAGFSTPDASLRANDIYGTAGRRLLVLRDDKVYFSRNIDPVVPVDRSDGSFEGILAKPDEDPENFVEGDYHQIPHSPSGLGIASWGDTAVVFTTDGVWLISNMDLEPVDNDGTVQQTLTHSAPQVVLWHRNGIAPFQDALVVPARDGIYIMGEGSLERVDTPITPLYRSYHRDGYTLGLATVMEGHYILPILSGTDYVDTLVCRLDRPATVGRSSVYPWSHFSGLPIRAFTQQETADAPNLLIASTGDKLLKARYFEQTPSDDNGTAFTSQLVTRDLPTGAGNKNLVREIDVDYDLVDTADGDDPTLICDFAEGHPAETASYTSAGDNGLEGTDQFKRWLLDAPPRTRTIRVRLRSSGRLQSLLIRSIGILARSSTKND